MDGRGEVGEGEEVVELPQLRRRADGRHVVRLRYRRRALDRAAAAIGPSGGGRGRGGRRRGAPVPGRLVLGGAVPGLGERGGAGDDVQQTADVRHRLLLRRVLLCKQAGGLNYNRKARLNDCAVPASCRTCTWAPTLH